MNNSSHNLNFHFTIFLRSLIFVVSEEYLYSNLIQILNGWLTGIRDVITEAYIVKSYSDLSLSNAARNKIFHYFMKE